MNLEEMIKKYLGEWLNATSNVRIDLYWGAAKESKWLVSFFNTENDLGYTTQAICSDVEKGLETIKERLQKG